MGGVWGPLGSVRVSGFLVPVRGLRLVFVSARSRQQSFLVTEREKLGGDALESRRALGTPSDGVLATSLALCATCRGVVAASPASVV